MVVAHNLLAMNANRQFNINTNLKAKSTEKLSSGYKINRASDDAAGLSISEKMRWQIRGLNRGSKNIQDGISLTQVADGALNEVHAMVHRIRELAIQSANGTNSDDDREYIQNEIDEINNEIERTLGTTDFNGMKIFKIPYMLEVSGDLSDNKIFNSYSGKSGGLLIDDKRYTWGELGASLNIDTFTQDFECDVVNASGERLNYVAKKGDTLDDIVRIYQITSDEEGIYVNNMPAARWEGTPMKGKWKEIPEVKNDNNEYSFSYNGATISFEAQEGDDVDKLISILNPDSESEERTMYFTGVVADKEKYSAAVTSSSSITDMVITINESNKDDILDYRYKVSADEDGVTIEQFTGEDDGITHKKIAWSSFVNVKSGQPFKFTDWGIEDEGLNPETFSSKATYEYVDNTSGKTKGAISFTFTVDDEASKDDIIRGLNSMYLESGIIEAPLNKAYIDNPNVLFKTGKKLDDSTSLSFEYVEQKDMLCRDFDDDSDVMDIKIVRTRVPYSTVYSCIHTKIMTEVYLRRYNEVIDSEGNVTDSYYTDEKYTSQQASDTGTTIDSEGRTIRYSYEKNSDGSLALYKKTGSDLKTISGQLYEVDENGDIVGSDDDHTHYSEASGSTQKYVAIGEANAIDKIYRTCYNHYDYYNSNGDNIAVGQSSKVFVDTREGIVDWKGRSVTVSSVDVSPTITLLGNRDKEGWKYDIYDITYPTQFAEDDDVWQDLRSQLRGIQLVYDNTNDAPDSSTNDIVHIKIPVASKATSTFAKKEDSKGRSYHTIFEAEPGPANADKSLHIQAGPQQDNGIDMIWSGMNLTTLGIGNVNVKTQNGCIRALKKCDKAIETVSSVRSTFGAYQNRLEHSYNVNTLTAENLDASESRIRDTDMAEEMVKYTKHSILEQAGQSMLSQANQSTQSVLNILRS